MYERRSEHRRLVLKRGRVLVPGRPAYECLVRDLTQGGARLEFKAPVLLPAEVMLCLVSTDLTIPAVCIWQRRLEAGVRFVGVATLGAVESPPARSAAA
jgi:hypothetical protein